MPALQRSFTATRYDVRNERLSLLPTSSTLDRHPRCHQRHWRFFRTQPEARWSRLFIQNSEHGAKKHCRASTGRPAAGLGLCNHAVMGTSSLTALEDWSLNFRYTTFSVMASL